MTIQYENNVKIVKELFAACERKDFAAVLGYLDESIDWQSPATGTAVREIPWSKPRHGKSEVKAFFDEVRDRLHVDEISCSTIVADGDHVFVEGTKLGSVPSTGCFFRVNFAMALTLRNGKIVRLRNYYDSAEIAAAFLAKGEECQAMCKAA